MPPRQNPEQLGILPNWSTVVDFATTDAFTEWHQGAQSDETPMPGQAARHREPDRIFATCEGSTEGGGKGSITEYRQGLKATISLDIEFGAGMRQGWVLPFSTPPSFEGYLLLLAMPDFTAGLLIPIDFSSATPVDPASIRYDVSSTTLVLANLGPSLVQVTRRHIVLVTQHTRYGQSNT